MTAEPGTGEFSHRRVLPVLGVPIDVIDSATAIQRISQWAQRHESRYVCICNVHSVVTATIEPLFMQALINADMATPDGSPIAWQLRRQGAQGQQRVSGPDLMLEYFDHAASMSQSIYLYGSTQNTLDLLVYQLHQRWPHLVIAGAYSPPFRPLTLEEDEAIIKKINSSGAGTVWVSLGCPKQERWMAMHRGRINAVMLGVGAAFDFHAGKIARAPAWMRNSGLEWLHRLCTDPRRLGRRYLTTNTSFLLALLRQLLANNR